MNVTQRSRRRPARESRRGAIVVLTAFVLIAVLSVAGFLMSLSYAELANAELQAATDAAARSAIVKMVVTQSQDEARAAALDIASRHRVSGQPLLIDGLDVDFGNSQRQADGTFNFQPNQSPFNAASVSGRKTADSAAGAVDLPFGSFIGQKTFETQRAASAMRLDYDIVLVLDRSGSMAWDLSEFRFSYPANRLTRPLLENYFSPPSPFALIDDANSLPSRWKVLADSVDGFLQVLVDRNVSARVALVTFASDYQFGLYSSVTVTTNSDFSENYSLIQTAMTLVGQIPLIGDTNISAGLQQGQTLLTTSPLARPKTAQPIVVLFSDGIYTEGGDPVPVAQSMNAATGTIIHCVSFGGEAAAQQTMDDIANAGGKGLSLHADTAAELVSSFEKIANSIPVIVIK